MFRSTSDCNCLAAAKTGIKYPLHRAAFLGHTECLRTLFGRQPERTLLSDRNNNTPLHAAASAGSVEAARYLLEETKISRLARNKSGETCGHTAVRRRKLAMLKLLLADSLKEAGRMALARDANGNTMLHCAVLANDNDCALLLLQRFGKAIANIANADDVLPLHVAAAQGNLEFIRIATKYDLSMTNRRDVNGATSAFYAAQAGHIQCLKYLVDKARCDIHATTRKGQSLLTAAALNGHSILVQWLLSKMNKTAIYQQTTDAATSFHCAAFAGHCAILKMLYKAAGSKKFLLNSTDRNGNTPLHLAATNDHFACVKLLLDLGADAAIKNKASQTAAEIAEQRCSNRICDLLRKHVSQTCTAEAVSGKIRSVRETLVEILQDVANGCFNTFKCIPPFTTLMDMTATYNNNGNHKISSGQRRDESRSDELNDSANAAKSLKMSFGSITTPSSGYASSSENIAIKENNSNGNSIEEQTWSPIVVAAEDHNSLNRESSPALLCNENWLLKSSDCELQQRNLLLTHNRDDLDSPQQRLFPLNSFTVPWSTKFCKCPYISKRDVETQTEQDNLQRNVMIVDDLNRIIFSSTESLPGVFHKSGIAFDPYFSKLLSQEDLTFRRQRTSREKYHKNALGLANTANRKPAASPGSEYQQIQFGCSKMQRRCCYHDENNCDSEYNSRKSSGSEADLFYASIPTFAKQTTANKTAALKLVNGHRTQCECKRQFIATKERAISAESIFDERSHDDEFIKRAGIAAAEQIDQAIAEVETQKYKNGCERCGEAMAPTRLLMPSKTSYLKHASPYSGKNRRLNSDSHLKTLLSWECNERSGRGMDNADVLQSHAIDAKAFKEEIVKKLQTLNSVSQRSPQKYVSQSRQLSPSPIACGFKRPLPRQFSDKTRNSQDGSSHSPSLFDKTRLRLLHESHKTYLDVAQNDDKVEFGRPDDAAVKQEEHPDYDLNSSERSWQTYSDRLHLEPQWESFTTAEIAPIRNENRAGHAESSGNDNDVSSTTADTDKQTRTQQANHTNCSRTDSESPLRSEVFKQRSTQSGGISNESLKICGNKVTQVLRALDAACMTNSQSDDSLHQANFANENERCKSPEDSTFDTAQTEIESSLPVKYFGESQHSDTQKEMKNSSRTMLSLLSAFPSDLNGDEDNMDGSLF